MYLLARLNMFQNLFIYFFKLFILSLCLNNAGAYLANKFQIYAPIRA